VFVSSDNPPDLTIAGISPVAESRARGAGSRSVRVRRQASAPALPELAKCETRPDMRPGSDLADLGLRFATPQDAPALVSLIRSAYRGDASRAGWTSEADLVEGERIDLDSLLRLLGAPASRILVVEDHSNPVACCQLENREAGVVYLGTFAVCPQRQGQGLGGWLIEQAERASAKTFGAHTIEITVVAQQAALLAWYERRGFVRTGQTRPFPANPRYARPLRDDLHFVVLSKAVSTQS
jgi:GNAT superfamily N-acetyltransferase